MQAAIMVTVDSVTSQMKRMTSLSVWLSVARITCAAVVGHDLHASCWPRFGKLTHFMMATTPALERDKC